jgi:hypothetical protein
MDAAPFQLNIPAHVASHTKTSWFHSSSSLELRGDHGCCVDSGLKDCDQTQFFPRSRRIIEKSGSQDLCLGLLSCSGPESGFGPEHGFAEPLLAALPHPLTSIRSVRLLI